ncbi:hypothetical protein [Kitasatospora sp. NPDC057541]|uniref:hypothetical protein n=1 Tax=unclassified Kitasatospora TaxID=2633591 RepID=UPI0036B1B85D
MVSESGHGSSRSSAHDQDRNLQHPRTNAHAVDQSSPVLGLSGKLPDPTAAAAVQRRRGVLVLLNLLRARLNRLPLPDRALAWCWSAGSTRRFGVGRAVRVGIHRAAGAGHGESVARPVGQLLAVGEELSDLAQWPAVAEQLRTLLRHDPGSQGYRRALLLIPLIGGRPVRLLAHQLQSTLWPGTDLFDTWDTTLPTAHPTPLADAVIDAHQALQCLSGLAHLATLRDADPRHQNVADRAMGQFQQAHHSIMALRPGDPVIGEVVDFLAALARRVGSEHADGARCRDTGVPNLAASIAEGGTGRPTDDFLQLNGLITIALQWDLDPGRAAQLLARVNG